MPAPNIAHFDIDEMREQYSAVADIFKARIGEGSKLSFEQVTQVFQRLDASFTEADLRELWTELDKDKSGDIDYLELLHFVFKIDEMMDASMEDHKGLIKTAVYCRIRPFGKDGHDIGEAVEKELDGWTENSVFVKDRHQRVEYKWPKQVLTPEATQEETYKVVMHDVVDAWIMNATNVMFLAYGQTGTGKTHTMFGPKESLSSDTAHPDWGLFPRAAHSCLSTFEVLSKAYEGTDTKGAATLRASAIEFYMGRAFDLLNNKAPLALLPDGSPVNPHDVKITKVSDLAPFLDTVAANRTMSATKMNSGSSRSHCALILTIANCGSDPGKDEIFYLKRSLTLLDMAGAERPDKAGTERFSATQIMEVLSSGKTPTKTQQQGMEGTLINFDLSMLKSEISKATEMNKKKNKYRNNCFPGAPLYRYIGRCLVGQAWLTSIVCLSQSPQNGWETWFSCEYGKDLEKLQAPVRKVKLEDGDALVERLTAAMEKAKKAHESTPKTNQYCELRKIIYKQVCGELAVVQGLLADARNCKACGLQT